jgi:hypothetical protein
MTKMKGYQPMPMAPNGVFYAKRTARKEHPCAARAGCTIRSGEEYIEQVTARWAEIPDDVTDEGVVVGYPLGHWERARFHNHPIPGLTDNGRGY